MAAYKCKPIPELSAKDIAHFWSKVDVRRPDECWPWKGPPWNSGYGQFGLCRNNHPSNFKPSRIAYFLHYGEDPAPLFVLHRCDNPPCCNGKHLFKGTQKDNIEDMYSKGREFRTIGDASGSRRHPERVPKGEANGLAKLTSSQVRLIRWLHESGVYLHRELGEMFGVSKVQVTRIINRKQWRHIAG